MTAAERHILIIDDEAPMRHMLRMVLERDGYTVSEATSGRQGLDRLQSVHYSLVLCDIRMPEMDGLSFLKEKQAQQFGGTVIMMSAYGSVDTAVECMKQGAYDYISKPFRPDEVLLTVRKAEERLQLCQENVQLCSLGHLHRLPKGEDVGGGAFRQSELEGALILTVSIVFKIVIDKNPGPESIHLHFELTPLDGQLLFVPNHET